LKGARPVWGGGSRNVPFGNALHPYSTRRSFLLPGALMTPPKNTDRNLLFGILAHQMDFITRDELVSAMQAWVLNKAKGLGELMVERGILQLARRNLLEALVEEHLNTHQGDARASLAVAVHVSAAARDLRAIGDADLFFTRPRIRPG